MEIWIVGKIQGGEFPNYVWEIQGAFSEKEKAASVCKNDSWFKGPLILDELVPEESLPWPGAIFPKSERAV